MLANAHAHVRETGNRVIRRIVSEITAIQAAQSECSAATAAHGSSQTMFTMITMTVTRRWLPHLRASH